MESDRGGKEQGTPPRQVGIRKRTLVLLGISACITMFGITTYVFRKPGDGFESIISSLVVLMGIAVAVAATYEVVYHLRHRNDAAE